MLIGCLIAYLLNPLAKLYERKLFQGMKRGERIASILLALFSFVAVIVILIAILLPQLISNIISFLNRLPEYQESIHSLFQRLGITKLVYIPESADEVMEKTVETLRGYENDIIAFWTGVAKALMNIVIGAVLSIYLLASKDKLKADFKELLSALLTDEKLDRFVSYFRRCDYILNRYLVFTILDSVIVGVLNAVIMLVLRMPYIGLISIIVGVTNLIPTFGPIIGAVFGGLILFLDSPLLAVIFVAATFVLQGCDGYIIKPKLFGDSLGVSGLLILLAIVSMGNMFGVSGLLLAIPFSAVCDFTYRDVILPSLKKRKAEKEAMKQTE